MQSPSSVQAWAAPPPAFALTLIACLVVGIFAGVLWGILAGYASRLVDPEQRGRVTIALDGTPIALALGTTVGALLAAAFGWRLTSVVMTVATCVLVRDLAIVPDSPVRRNTSGPRR